MTDLLPIQDPVLVFALVALLILLAPLVMGRWRLPGTIGLLLAGAVLGPNALGVLARDSSFVLFGTVGLLYIMFTAALEIDMAVLKRYRLHGIVFGLLTFSIPQGIGMLVGRYLLGFDWPATILLGSVFASHTLLAYPIASRLGLSRDPAVTTAVGGTIITDTLALLVLAVIAGSTRGEAGDTLYWRLGISLLLYVAFVLFGLPRLARWYFRNMGRDGVAEFVFVLAAVFGCASLAHLAGSEPIVGAFLAGLALNRLIPHNSTLMNRIRFTGDAVFIPFFLLSVGMLLDVRVFFAGLQAWLITAGMVGTVVLTKWLAAEATRPLLGYSRDQARVVFGLSVAQAAATLAATLVGYQIGLFDDLVVNGAIMMILVTCVLAPVMVERHGRALALRVAQEDAALAPSQQRILVALPERRTGQALLDLAMLVRDPTHGQPVFPISVIEDDHAATHQLAAAERSLSLAVEQLSAADVPATPLTRIDLNLAAGILRARRELRGTDVIIGWSERSSTAELFFGSILQKMLGDREYTLMLLRHVEPTRTCRRVVLAVPPNADHEPGFAVAIATVKRLARQLGGGVLMLAEQRGEADMAKRVRAIAPQVELRSVPVDTWAGVIRAIVDQLKDDDLLVLHGVRAGGLAWRASLERLPSRLAARFPASDLLVIYPPEPRDDSVLPSLLTPTDLDPPPALKPA
jgi:Kef-type K+ transport system membrane component KefB/nucleotide-binding universal stress UspA family protein